MDKCNFMYEPEEWAVGGRQMRCIIKPKKMFFIQRGKEYVYPRPEDGVYECDYCDGDGCVYMRILKSLEGK